MFYIFHGDEEFTRTQAVARFRAQIIEDGAGELNIVDLDGANLALHELISACNTLPFMTQRRLVIVHDMLQRYENARADSAADQEAAQLAEYLSHMPETARLVFIESTLLNEKNALLKRAVNLEKGHIRAFKRLDPRKPQERQALERWIAQQAQSYGVSIDRNAVALLIERVGNDLRFLDQELAKLAAWVNYQGTITVEDINLFIAPSMEANIFALVEALGQKKRQEALRALHALLADPREDALRILAMIARQIRLIMAAKELLEKEKRSSSGIARALQVPPFVAQELQKQARLFTFQELYALLKHTLEIDYGIKTSQVEPALALEMLILHACRNPLGAKEP